MGRRDALALLALLVLAILLTAELAELADRAPAARSELARARVERLTPELEQRLGQLDGELLLTYHVSARDRMPVDRRHLEASVSGLLAAMEAAGRGRVAWQVIDPQARPDLADYLAADHVAPVRVRVVARDAWAERSLHSTLTLAYGARSRVRLAGLGPEHLPGLQAWILAHLDQLERPARARIAVAAPAQYAQLRAELAREGEVLESDFDQSAQLPQSVDLLVWVAPQAPREAHLRALEALRARGGSVLLAGSAYSAVARPGGRFAFEPTGLTPELLRGLGLAPAQALVLDEQCEEVRLDGALVRLPFALRCIAPDQDFRELEGQPNGTLVLEAPLAVAPDSERLERARERFIALCSSSSGAWLQAVPPEPVQPAAFARAAGEAAPRRTLAALLAPDDPWRGPLVFLGAPTPLSDGQLAREDVASRRLLQVLARNLASTERLVIARAPRPVVEPLPDLPLAARLAWRALLLLALPLPCLFLLLRRADERRGAPRARALAAAGALGAALLLIAAGAALLRRVPAQADLSREQLALPSPETVALAGRLGAPVEVALVFGQRLPPGLREVPDRAEALLDALARAGAPLRTRRVAPDLLEPGDLAELGVSPRTFLVQGEDRSSGVRTCAAIVLRQGERREVLDFPSALTAEALELRLAFALHRLDPRAAPHARRGRIALAADVPRLSAAEAHLEYQSRGLFAPTGADVHGLARELLAAHDFEIVQVDLRAPVLPEDCDLLVWLQPRRPTEALHALLRTQLERGGNALVAAQHFKVRTRQVSESGFATVHWPQPQLPDLDRGLFPELGLELVREVLCDVSAATLALEAEVERAGAGRETRAHASALPFQLLATPAGFERAAPLVAGLGEQLFLWGNRWRFDGQALAARGLQVTPLMRTSAQAWALDWKGGYLDPAELVPPQAPERRLGPQPLALLVEGAFAPAAPRARLLLLGSSEIFENRRLQAPYRGDHLLLNAAASLALSEDLGRIAARRPSLERFEPPQRAQALALRAALVGGLPLLLLLAAALGRLARRAP